MRKIKFRAWDITNKVMAEIDELDDDFDFIKDGDRVRSTIRWQDLFNGDYPDVIPMQFIGLKDKNGKEVYEGDVVQAFRSGRKDLKFEIKYVGRAFVMWQDGDKSEMDCIWFFEFEIIGNIYENPELLAGKKEAKK